MFGSYYIQVKDQEIIFQADLKSEQIKQIENLPSLTIPTHRFAKGFVIYCENNSDDSTSRSLQSNLMSGIDEIVTSNMKQKSIPTIVETTVDGVIRTQSPMTIARLIGDNEQIKTDIKYKTFLETSQILFILLQTLLNKLNENNTIPFFFLLGDESKRYNRRAYSKQDIRNMYKALHAWKITKLGSTYSADEKKKIEQIAVLAKAFLDPYWVYHQNPPKQQNKQAKQSTTSITEQMADSLRQQPQNPEYVTSEVKRDIRDKIRSFANAIAIILACLIAVLTVTAIIAAALHVLLFLPPLIPLLSPLALISFWPTIDQWIVEPMNNWFGYHMEPSKKEAAVILALLIAAPIVATLFIFCWPLLIAWPVVAHLSAQITNAMHVSAITVIQNIVYPAISMCKQLVNVYLASKTVRQDKTVQIIAKQAKAKVKNKTNKIKEKSKRDHQRPQNMTEFPTPGSLSFFQMPFVSCPFQTIFNPTSSPRS